MNNFLDFLQLSLDTEQLVSFKRVLPLPQKDFHLWEHQRVVGDQITIEDTRGLESVSKLHNEFVEERVSGAFVIVHVGHGCGCDTVESHPTVALADLVLQRD